MSAWPLIQRELRAEARRPFPYRLRVYSLLVMILGVAVVAMIQGGLAAGSGATLLVAIHIALVTGIWLIVPTLTADCISREVREGTLGLLLLTPLTAIGIIIGKSLLQVLRAASFLLAAIPLLGICLLLGGASGTQIGFSIIINASMFCLALAAGLLASVHTDRWMRAVVRAWLLNALFVLLFAIACVLLIHFQILPVLDQYWHQWPMLILGVIVLGILGVDAWMVLCTVRMPLGGLTPYFLELLLLSVVVLGYAILFAAGRLRRLSAGQLPTHRERPMERVLYTPFLFRNTLRGITARLLELNPVAWLQQRLPQARVAKWVLCLVAVIWMTVGAYSRNFRGLDNEGILWLLAGLSALAAFVSAVSFRSERQAGVFELLLVTPLSVRSILAGRILGIYWLLFPAVALSVGMIWVVDGYRSIPDWNIWQLAFWLAVGNLLAIPLFGINAALRMKSSVGAWLATCVFALAYPVAQSMVMGVLYVATQVVSRSFQIGNPVIHEPHAVTVFLIFTVGMLFWNTYLISTLWRRLNERLTRTDLAMGVA